MSSRFSRRAASTVLLCWGLALASLLPVFAQDTAHTPEQQAVLSVFRRNLEFGKTETETMNDPGRMIGHLKKALKSLDAYDGADRPQLVAEVLAATQAAVDRAKRKAGMDPVHQAEVIRELNDLVKAAGGTPVASAPSGGGAQAAEVAQAVPTPAAPPKSRSRRERPAEKPYDGMRRLLEESRVATASGDAPGAEAKLKEAEVLMSTASWDELDHTNRASFQDEILEARYRALPDQNSDDETYLQQAKRSISSARRSFMQGGTDAMNDDLDKAEDVLAKAGDGQRKALLTAELDRVAYFADEAIAAQAKRGILRQLERSAENLQDIVERGGEGYGTDGVLRSAQEALDSEEAKVLSDAEKAEWTERFADLKKQITDLALAAAFKEVEKTIAEDEAMISGKQEDTHSTWDSWRSQLDNLEERINAIPQDIADRGLEFPAGDPRSKALLDRIAKLREGVQQAEANWEQNELVGRAVDSWKQILEFYSADAQGWEQETEPPPYDIYMSHSPASLKLEKTKARYELADRWFDNDAVKESLEKFPQNPKVKATLAEVVKVRDESGGKVVKFVGIMLDQMEKAGPKDKWDSSMQRLDELQRDLEVSAKAVSGQEAALKRIETIRKRWENMASEEGARMAQIQADMKSSSEKNWAAWVQKWQPVEIDAAACVKDIASCKGKVVRFSGYPDRLGWDWYMDEYDWLTPVNGTPVIGKFDAGLQQAITDMQKASGHYFRDGDYIDEVVGVVETVCKADRREFYPISKEDYRAGTVEGPCIRIVAVRAKPFALAVGQGTSLDGVAGMPKVEVKEAGAMRKP